MRGNDANSKRRTGTPGATSASVGYEAQRWQIADALRGSMDAAEYKHVCLGLLFLKYTFARILRDRWQTDFFPQRQELLKMLVFAKDRNHPWTLNDIVRTPT
jgi:hypothetical protein